MTDLTLKMGLWGFADMGECECVLDVRYAVEFDYDDRKLFCAGATATLVSAQFGNASLPRRIVADILGEAHLAEREAAIGAKLAEEWTQPELNDERDAA